MWPDGDNMNFVIIIVIIIFVILIQLINFFIILFIIMIQLKSDAIYLAWRGKFSTYAWQLIGASCSQIDVYFNFRLLSFPSTFFLLRVSL